MAKLESVFKEETKVPSVISFSLPFCWKPEKFTCFILKLTESFVYGKELQLTTEEWQAIIQKWHLWENNWADKIDPKHLPILRTFDQKPTKQYNDTNSVLVLIQLIRNKYKHSKQFTVEQKSELGWFKLPITENSERDDYLFGKYWTSKFPNLVPFVWQYLREKYAESWTEFYRTGVNLKKDFVFPLENFVDLLCNDLANNMDQGWMEERFSVVDSPSSIVEVRIMNGDLLSSILDKSSVMQIQISRESLAFKWDDNHNTLEYKISACECLGDKTYSFILASTSTKIDEKEILEKFRGNKYFDKESTVVIFTNEDIVVSVVNKFARNTGFSHMPISWQDLSESQRNAIMAQDRESESIKYKIKLQGKELPFKDIFPGDENETENLLTHFQGQMLTQLLRNSSLKLLANHQLPRIQKYYMARKICNRSKLNSSIFMRASEDDIFIIDPSSSQNVEITLSIQIFATDYSDVFPKLNSCGRILLLSETIQDFDQLFSSFERVHEKSVHFLRYVKKDTFQWLGTKGDFSQVEDSFLDASQELGSVQEDTFLESLEESEKLIFIADQPGMGKSQILAKIAKQLVSKQSTGDMFVVLHFSVDDFVKDLTWKEGIGVEKIISSVIKLSALNKFEESVVKYWLTKGNRERIKVEIMFDGLDEVVDSELRYLALTAIKIIKQNIPFVRVWVTVRDYMLADIRLLYGVLGFKLEPFSNYEQIIFLVRFWRQSINLDRICFKLLAKLVIFARKCLQVCITENAKEISGIPLQCRMIAEIFEEEVISGTLRLARNMKYSLTDLYQKMIEKQFERFLREKEFLPESIPMNGYIAHAVRKDIDSFLTYYAIKLIFPESAVEKAKSLLFNLGEPDADNQLSRKAAERHGVIDDLNNLKFIHRTYAEIIVARFVHTNLKQRFIINSKLDISHEGFRNFIFVEVLDISHKNEAIDFGNDTNNLKYPTVCHFLNDMLNEQVSQISREFITLIAAWMKPGFQQTVFIDKARLIFAARKMRFNNIVILLVYSGMHIDFIFIWALLHQHFQLNKYLIENMNFGPEKWKMLQNIDDKRLSVLHLIIDGVRGNMEYPIIEIKRFMEYIVQFDKTLLFAVNAEKETPLQYLSHLITDMKLGTNLEILQELESFMRNLFENN